jgi:hypothetical protein
LQRVTNLCFLLKIHGCGIWFYGKVGMYNFHPIVKWWLKCSLTWWIKPRKFLSSLPLPFVLIVHVHLTFGCLVRTLTSLLLSLVENPLF